MIDIVIKFYGPDLLGESKISEHEGWIDGHSYSESMSSPNSTGTGSGNTTGRCTFHDVNFTGAEGVHSALLRNYMGTNQIFDKVEVHFLKQLKDNIIKPYQIRTFEKVLITNMGGSKTNDDGMHESWSFSAAKVSWDYKKQDDKGDLVAGGTAFFDQQTSTGNAG